MNINTFCVKADRAARLLKSLANPNRLMILCRLHEGECSVGALGELTRIHQSALSQHLARLRREGIVKTRREAQTIYYRLVDDQAAHVVKNLYALYCNPSKRRIPS